MKKIFKLIILVLFTSCQPIEFQGKTYALIYGVSDYSRFNGVTSIKYKIDNLLACQNDAKTMGKAFQDIFGNELELFLRIEALSTEYETEKKPNKAQFLEDIQTISNLITPQDRFIFYYAGHGISCDPRSISFDEDLEYNELSLTPEKREYLILAPPPTFTDLTYKDVFLSDLELGNALLSLSCEKKFVFLDCCYSGGMIIPYNDINASHLDGFHNSAFTLALQNYFLKNKEIAPYSQNTWILAASGEKGLSYESNTINHGFFTYFILKGFRYGDLNGDGYLSWSELARVTQLQSEDYKKKTSETTFTNSGDMLVTCSSGCEDVIFCPIPLSN